MPDALLGSAIGSVSNVGGDLFNAGNTLQQNRDSRKFSEKMYQRQYDDAIKFWGMQNDYNSPASQMGRFKDAGLNPNLIYGQGNSGPAAAIPVPDVTPAQFREPRVEGPRTDAMSILLGQADLRIKNAQADNLKVQNDVIRQDAILRAYQAERTGFDLDFNRDLVDVSADAKRESLRNMKLSNDVLLNRDAREATMNASNLREAAERMLTLMEQRKSFPLDRQKTRAEINNLINSGKLQEIEIGLRKKNINPNDPMYQRYLGMILSDVVDGRVTAETIGDGIWSWLFGK